MESSTLILAICRIFQLLFAAVVLGTSVSLTKYYTQPCNEDGCSIFDGITSAFEFGCFVGVVGLIDALVGIVAVFIDAIPQLVSLGLDVLACLSYAAGGGAIAGTLAKMPSTFCPAPGSRCTEIKADDAFQFLGLIITLVIIGLSFMWRGKGGRGSSYV